MATSTQIREWIAAAEAARHSVALGGVPTDIWDDGSRVKRAVSSIAELDKYLDTLKRELEAALLLESGTGRRARRAISLVYRD